MTNTLVQHREQTRNQHLTFFGVLRHIGRSLLLLVAVVVALLTTIPVVLLFFITAVPVWLSAVIALLDIGLIYGLLRYAHTPVMVGGGLVTLMLVSALAVGLSQVFAATPPITDADGNPVPGSIATLEQVELNSSHQWITVRGHSTDLPVLLFLAGGPGGSELAMTRKYLGELEQHFIVVNWDQPGTGKSYGAVPFDQLTPERYVQDGYALTQYLRERFDEDKIYVFGESWGTIPGIWLMQQHPDLYHAFISTGQMVDAVENDTRIYYHAIELAEEWGRTETVAQLRQNGPPPYPPETVIGKFGTFNGVLNDYMHAHAYGEGTGHNLMLDSLASPEYGLLDKVNWLVGLARTFRTVYPQLNDLDFREQVTTLDVPVYFIAGRWDVNTDTPLAREYFDLLDAPHKQWIWFEDSAHTPSWDEPSRFVDVMVNTVWVPTR
jgi:pimeloyl-ACP methyl ester carboxylesterase